MVFNDTEQKLFSEILIQVLDSMSLTITGEQLKQFCIYFQQLVSVNRQLNLTRLISPYDVAVKHMADSLAGWIVMAELDISRGMVDVGTGAGFPGLPIKIFRPEIKVTLVDSLAKRLIFLEKLLIQLGLEDVELLHNRSEDFGRHEQRRQRYSLVVARAVAPLNILCEYGLPILMTGGTMIAWKGPRYEEEIKKAQVAINILGGELTGVHKVELPGLIDARYLVIIKKTTDTPLRFPRKAGLPVKQPLS